MPWNMKSFVIKVPNVFWYFKIKRLNFVKTIYITIYWTIWILKCYKTINKFCSYLDALDLSEDDEDVEDDVDAVYDRGRFTAEFLSSFSWAMKKKKKNLVIEL